ncbi:MAG TPA: FlgD immunoglobulin-like domain containing protein, partial [bacterium]|nr:FlgD immunoglobulin-like domain containing protein [bacterium]
NGAGYAIMTNYDAVVWNTAELQNKTIGGAVQGGIQTYLDEGGRFFLASQGFLNHQGLTTLATDYLGISAFTQDAGAASGTGIASDPIGDGLSFTLSPPYTDNADHLTPSLATTWLEAPGNEAIGVRYDDGTFRTVFLSAPFEGIPPGDQPVVMGRILDWLVPAGGPVGADDVGTALAAEPVLRQNVPNPFRSATSVSFALPVAADVQLEVFDVAGRRVTELVSGRVEAGEHTVSWNGRNSAGRQVAAGVYLVRLSTPSSTLTRDVVLLR